MSLETREDLLVLEYGGTGRSGKGTIVSHLADTYEGITTEETGADYRAITRNLLLNNIIEQGMPPVYLEQQVQKVGSYALTEMVANRNELVAEIGLSSLYLPDVADLVGHISPITAVRKAVKAGFTRRVEAVRDNDESQVLLVDGRNLADVIKHIPGTRLLARTFVSCLEMEAAIRECYRQKLTPGSEAWRDTFDVAYNSNLARNKLDAERQVDPVKPEKDAINYWWDNEAMLVSALLTRLSDDSLTDDNQNAPSILLDWLMEKTHHKQQLRYGIGSIACRDQRQINFDTGVYRGHYTDPRGGMLTAARIMFEEALGMHPLTDQLTQRDTSDLPRLYLIKKPSLGDSVLTK